MIDAPNAEGQPFAEVAEDHFQFGIFIEQAAAHETERVKRSFHRESPGGTQERRVSGIRLLARGQWHARMKIEGYIELL